MTFFRDFFDELFLDKGGGKSGALILPKMCVFDLRNNFFRKKTKQKPFQKNIVYTQYWRFNTRYCSRLWKRIETRLSRFSTIEILSPGFKTMVTMMGELDNGDFWIGDCPTVPQVSVLWKILKGTAGRSDNYYKDHLHCKVPLLQFVSHLQLSGRKMTCRIKC